VPVLLAMRRPAEMTVEPLVAWHSMPGRILSSSARAGVTALAKTAATTSFEKRMYLS
jgi:hypothetical protein